MLDNPNIFDFGPGAQPRSTSPGEAQEFGTRHTYWRKLWSNFVGLCPKRITDIELMMSILCLVLPNNEDNEHVARLLIDKHGSFANAISAPLSDHDYVERFPPVAGIAFKVVHAAAERLIQEDTIKQPLLSNQKGLKQYLAPTLKQKSVEQVRVLFLDASERVIADESLAERGSPWNGVDPVEVLRRSLNWGAAGIALVQHSSNPNLPRFEDDLSLKLQVRDLCKQLNNRLLDFIVVRNHELLSFREQGLL